MCDAMWSDVLCCDGCVWWIGEDGLDGDDGDDGDEGHDGESGETCQNFEIMIEFVSENKDRNTRTYHIEHAGPAGKVSYQWIMIVILLMICWIRMNIILKFHCWILLSFLMAKVVEGKLILSFHC